ncbi:hypothetical protein [Hymenobacter sediminicola]|uniref:Uncharacterized protein n=1 Tax=Hymenobacter sediminicola TaxID=2761579 RepID=A0A7G7W322_9BACT|nr:hypothetical protein [Hymenobacter sediminicola]QNH60765.1 hypothetical protein H4317_11240 [Hymenobacter sediminicola]
MKLPLPIISLPTIVLWVLAIIVGLTNYHPSFLSYRAFTGILFSLAVLATVYLIWRGIRNANKPVR